MTKSPISSLSATLLAIAACGDDTPGQVPDTSADATTTADGADATSTTDTTPADTLAPRPDVVVDPSAFCQGTTHFAWDPSSGVAIAAMPDDAYTRDDATSLTGRRVSIGEPAWLGELAAPFQPVYRQLDELDGWGTSAGVTLRFDAPLGPLPSGSEASLASDELAFYDLGSLEDGVITWAATPTRIAYETQVLEEGKAVVVWPMHPLKERHVHAVVLTKKHMAPDRQCVAPSSRLVEAITAAPSDDPAIARVGREIDGFFATTGMAREDVSALTVFTTQDVSTVTLAQRADLRARSYDWKTAPTCQTKTDYIACKGTFDAYDYRREGYLGDELEPAVYTLPVRVWLPKTRSGPVPTLVFGHGLGGDANQAASIGSFLAPLGVAVVALPAPRHGDHPTARHDDPNAFFLDLLGIDLQAFTIDGFVFRENLRQAAFDKLQMMQLLSAHADIDGDGDDDLAMQDVAYWGISLGGIMGSDFSAMSDRIGAAILSIPGARLVSIVTDAADFATFKDLLASVAGSEDAVLALAPVAQALVDAGDPVNWAAHLLNERVDEAAAPDVLVQMVIDDGVVPNVTTRSLVRALGADVVGQVPPIIRPIDPLLATGDAPVRANVASTHTVGLFEFDRVSYEEGGDPEAATHGNIFSGIEGIGQVEAFVTSWMANRTGGSPPEIIDPYDLYGTRALGH